MATALAETPLDKLLASARTNPQMGEEYLNFLLNSEIFMPVWNDMDTKKPDEGMQIQPVLTNNEEGQYVMAFDTKERLENWLTEEIGGIAAIKGIDLFMMVEHKPIQICMNAGTTAIKVFSREEIRWVMQNVTKTE